MKLKKTAALSLACIMASSTVAYADISGTETIEVSDAPEIENTNLLSDILPAEDPADIPAVTPTFDDYNQSETDEVSDTVRDESVAVASDESAAVALDEPAAVASDEPAVVDFYDDSTSTEELVGASSYRSIYEPCFSKVKQMNQQQLNEYGGYHWRYKGSPKPKSSDSPFKDALTPAYKTAIIWAAEKGITKGFSDNTFRDKQYCTRGEIVTFLYRVK